MEFSNAIPFENTRIIGKVNGFSSIAYETYLKQTIRSIGNRLHAPDCQDKPLPKRPETYKATCLPCSCLKCQLPSRAYGAVKGLRFANLTGFALFAYFYNKDS